MYLNFDYIFFQLPFIAKGVGKNQFKRHFELFIDSIFYSLVRTVISFVLIINSSHMVAHCLVLLILDQDVLWKLSVFPIFASYWKSMAFKDSLYMWNLGLPCKLNSQGLMNHLWPSFLIKTITKFSNWLVITSVIWIML